jgi:hypothetical protein
MAYPGQTNDQGLITFVGDYVNKDTPLWLSMFGPTPGPGNVQVSSITVAAPGFVKLDASTIQTVPSPLSQYAPVVFDRGITDVTTYNTGLQMNVSNNVQGITPDEPFLSVTKQNGTRYDDLAMNGLQIFGNQLTDATVNAGAVGYLTGTGDAVTLRTNAGGSFNTSTINAATLNAQTANISTLNVSSLSANSITATTFISSSTAVSQNLTTATANISTALISTASISTASISTLTARRAVVQTNTLTGALLLNTDGIDINSQFALRQRSVIPSGGTDMIAAPAVGGKIRMFTGSPNVNTINPGNLSMELNEAGTVTIFRDMNVSSISTGVLTSPFISVSSILTNDLSFKPSLAPNVDLGLGGVVGGLIGGAAANTFNAVLGATALGTGIAGLTMPRTTGGLTTNTFQTYAGTSQIQFSTLGSATTTGFLTTTNGIGAFGSTISTTTTIPANSWAFRTVSDPLNIATNPSTIGATSTIQAASQWNKVFPGQVSMNTSNAITTLASQNNIIMGGASGTPLSINTNYAGSDPNIQLNPTGAVVIGGGQRLSVPALEGVTSINGTAFPSGVGVPIGTMLMWPVGAYGTSLVLPPGGYLLCDGSLQSTTTYPTLSGILGNSWNPNYPAANPAGQFYLPMSLGRMPVGGIPSTYTIIASFQGVVTISNIPGGGSRQGARFTNIQQPVTGSPAQLYRGMVMTQPFSSGGPVKALFSAGLSAGSGWFDDMYVLFTTDVFSPAVPPTGTEFTFTMANSTDVPTVGLTNQDGGKTAEGYGTPYRVQQTTEVAVHTHPANRGSGGSTTTISGNNPIQGNNTDTPNGQYSISGVGAVAEAYLQNPANFGVNFIIKAL